MMDIQQYMSDVGRRARAAARLMARATTAAKNEALLAMADAIDQASTTLTRENERDLEAGRDAGLDEALLDRLMLNAHRIGHG